MGNLTEREWPGAIMGGTTAGLQAYFSDKFGWKDFNLFVPFCGNY